MKRATSIAQILATALGSIGVGVLAEATGGAGHQALRSASDQPASGTKIRMKVGDRVVTATLIDNATSRDLVSMLPLTVTLEDHAATEKIGYLPRKLSTEGAPAGSDPALGDVAYYAPWGELGLVLQGLSPLERAHHPGKDRLRSGSAESAWNREGGD